MAPKKRPSAPYTVHKRLTNEEEGRYNYARSGPIKFDGELWYPVGGLRPANASWTGGYGVYFVNDDHTDYLTYGFKYHQLTRILFDRIRNVRKDIYGIDREYNYYYR